MLDFSSIAIFMLGTTIKNSRFPQPQPTYYESRIVPIYETWASFFPHVYFVFGTNQYDYHFLQDHACTLKKHEGDVSDYITTSFAVKKEPSDVPRAGRTRSRQRPRQQRGNPSIAPRRHLKASAKQIPSSNATYMFWCSIDTNDRYWSHPADNQTTSSSGVVHHIPAGSLSDRLHHWIDSHFSSQPASEESIALANITKEMQNVVSKSHHHHRSIQVPHRPLKVLLTGNCTGEYFGIGPTCRCQETMRYFYRHMDTTFKDIQWFLFMDDDIYFRPFSLLSMLRHVEHNASLGINHHFKSGQIMALVGAGSTHGDQLKPKMTKNQTVLDECKEVLETGYSYAQPALINRKTMNILKPAIDHHGMTAMHTHWGGSHDSILGFVFWMYDIPTYSFNKYLFPTRVMIHNTNKDVFTVKLKRRNSVFVHHVICADQYQYRTVDRQRKAEISGRIACQYNIAEMLNDDVLYNNQSFAETMSPETVVKYYEALQSQWRAGLDSSKLLIAMANTTVSNIRRTIFRERAIRLPEYFEPFTPFDCKLHANAMP